MRRTWRRDPRAAGRRNCGRLGVPVARPARDRRAAAADGGAVAQPRRLVRNSDAAIRQPIGRGWRCLCDRCARGVHRDPLHRAVHGRGLGRGAGPAMARRAGGVRGAGAGAGDPVPVARLRALLAQALTQARGVDGDVPPHIVSADVADGARARVGAGAASGGRRADAGPRRSAVRGIRLMDRWTPSGARLGVRLGCARRAHGGHGRWRNTGEPCACKGGRGGGRERGVHRGQARRPAQGGPPGVRLFHGRLVPDVQGQ